MRRCVNAIYSILTLVAVASCTQQPHHASGVAWGTTFHVTYTFDNDLTDSIHHIIEQVNSSLSPFEATSLVSRLNSDTALTVDAMVKDVFNMSCFYNRLSQGRFDPTLGPLINLWGFGPAGERSIPSSEEIDSVMRHVGIADCILHGDTLKKPCREMQFNFSAIAKGYGVDCISEMLTRNGVDDYLIEVGGEIALKGHPASRPEGWVVMIDAPILDETGAHNNLATFAATDCCIATSGNYRNYRFDNNGEIYSHTIDARTGHPFKSKILSATIIARECASADALATIAMASEFDDITRILDDTDSEGMFVLADCGDETKFTLFVTPGFPELSTDCDVKSIKIIK